MPRKNLGVKSVNPALKASYSELAAECTALKIENAKLHKRIVKLEAQKLSAENRILALEEHLKETEHHQAPSLGDIKNLDNLAKTLAQSLIDPKTS